MRPLFHSSFSEKISTFPEWRHQCEQHSMRNRQWLGQLQVPTGPNELVRHIPQREYLTLSGTGECSILLSHESQNSGTDAWSISIPVTSPLLIACLTAVWAICPNFRCASLIDILAAKLACSVSAVDFPSTSLYSPSAFGTVAMDFPEVSRMVHMPPPKMVLHPASSRRPTDINVNENPGAWTASLSMTGPRLSPLGKWMITSPTPAATCDRPSAVRMDLPTSG